jgi:hypothetical protein
METMERKKPRRRSGRWPGTSDLTGTAVRAWVARAKTERREAAALTSAERSCRDFVGETVIAVSRLILSP